MSRLSKKFKPTTKGTMKVETLKDIIRDIRKPYKDEDNFNLASHLIDYYYTNIYNGDEIPSVSLIYFNALFLELTLWLGVNESRFKQGIDNQNVYNNFFKKEITKARVNTYEERVKLYWNWLGGKENLNNPLLNKQEKDVLRTLFLLCPTIEAENRQRAKESLDIVLTKEELEKQLKRIRK